MGELRILAIGRTKPQNMRLTADQVGGCVCVQILVRLLRDSSDRLDFWAPKKGVGFCVTRKRGACV